MMYLQTCALLTNNLQIYLGMEQREHNVELKAMTLVSEFVKKFRSIDFTLHPSDIPGESAGKGSNVAWAARKLSERYSLEARKNVIITGIDGTFCAPVYRLICPDLFGFGAWN